MPSRCHPPAHPARLPGRARRARGEDLTSYPLRRAASAPQDRAASRACSRMRKIPPPRAELHRVDPQHDPSGHDCCGLRVERGKALGDGVGIDEGLDAQQRPSGGLPRPMSSRRVGTRDHDGLRLSMAVIVAPPGVSLLHRWSGAFWPLRVIGVPTTCSSPLIPGAWTAFSAGPSCPGGSGNPILASCAPSGATAST